LFLALFGLRSRRLIGRDALSRGIQAPCRKRRLGLASCQLV
jgi:hypothetical protein